ncbi:hypothetical protein [Malaciobacter canalis]|uniref:hypothetical protein n=1 Tax=Malaciobacter canalis TaxID=1912871 RepID=UPI00384C2922
MTKNGISILTSVLLINVMFAKDIDPFAVNNGNIPTKSEYSKELFKFNYNYPSEYKKPLNRPWFKVTNNKPLTKKNAYDYIMALKQYVAPSMKTFIINQNKWNKSSQKGWYSMLWAGETYL